MLDRDDLQRLARRIASGELRGNAALTAVARLIAAEEVPRAATPSERQQIYAEIVTALRDDDELRRTLSDVEGPRGPASASAAPERHRVVPPSSLPKMPRVLVTSSSGGTRHRAGASASSGARPVPRATEDVTGEIAVAGRSSRMLAVGVALGAAVIVAGVWALSRSGPCEALARRVCLESGADDCNIASLQVALREHAVNATVCKVASEALDGALPETSGQGREAVLRETLLKALGFDVVPGEPEAAASVVAPRGPLEVARDQSGMLGLVADQAFLYWSRTQPPGVFRVRSIGGTVERLGGTHAPADLAVSDHAVYWRERGPEGSSLWADPKRGEYEPERVPLVDIVPAVAAFLGPEVVYADEKTGAISIAPVAGGAAPRELVPGTGIVPTHLVGDATHVYWVEPPPTSRVLAVSQAGGVQTALGSAKGVRRFKIGAQGLWLIDGEGDLHLWERRACESADCMPLGEPRSVASDRSPVADVVSDARMMYWSEPEAGVVASMPLAGGAIVPIAQNLANPDCLAIDGAAVYWEAAGVLSRWAK